MTTSLPNTHMAQKIKKQLENALSSGFLAVTLVWGVAAFVVSVTPVEDSGDFRAAFPSGSRSSVSSSASSVSSTASSVSSTDICSDGIDNDGDGYIDSLDSDCDGMHPAADEAGDPVVDTCADAIDNDADGPIDMMDSDCVVNYYEG